MLKRAALVALLLPLPIYAQEVDCATAMTQADMNQCAGQDFAAADADLNAAFRKAMDRMKTLDANVPPARRGAEDSLRKAQRAWIIVRDAGCDARGRIYQGGSVQPMVVAGCMAEVTRARTVDLQSLVDEGSL